MDEYFHNTTVFNIENIEITVRYNTMKEYRLDELRSQFEDVLTRLKNNYGITMPTDQRRIHFFVYNDRKTYVEKSMEFFKLPSDNGGLTVSGITEVPTCFTYKKGLVMNAKHEFTHAVHMVTNANLKGTPDAIIEGFAQHVMPTSVYKYSAVNMNSDLSISDILKLGYSYQLYVCGYLLIDFLMESEFKYLINDIITSRRPLNECIDELKTLEPHYQAWKQNNTLQKFAKGFNLFYTAQGRYIGSYKDFDEHNNIVIKDAYECCVCNAIDNSLVCILPTKFLYATYDYLTVMSCLRYNLLLPDDAPKWICNTNKGSLYVAPYKGTFPESLDYYRNLYNMMVYAWPFYDVVKSQPTNPDDVINKLIAEKQRQNSLTSEEYFELTSDKIRIQLYKEALNGIVKATPEQYKEKAEITFQYILDLINLPLTILSNKVRRELLPNECMKLSTKKTGNFGAVILKDRLMNNKAFDTELIAEYGYYVDGYVTYENKNLNMNKRVPYSALLAYDKDSIHFVDSLSEADEHYDFKHFHVDEMLHIDKRVIDNKANVVKSLLPVGIHSESKYTKNKVSLITQGALLDNKGTGDVSDDIHSATLQNQTLTHVGYYISEDGEFFINDYGKNVIYQIRKGTFHLRLKTYPAFEAEIILTDNFEDSPPKQYMKLNASNFYQVNDVTTLYVFPKLEDYTNYRLEFDTTYEYLRRKDGQLIRLYDNEVIMSWVRVIDEVTNECVCILQNSYMQYIGDKFINRNVNYSQIDFILDPKPNVEIKDGVATFEHAADTSLTDNNYYDEAKIYLNAGQ